MSERLVFVYKSHNKQGRYLYLKEKDVFSHIPATLLDAFGTPEFVMMFALSKHKTLPKVSVEDLDKALEEKGYFLRIDLEDVEENLINQERKFRGMPLLSKEELSDLFKYLLLFKKSIRWQNQLANLPSLTLHPYQSIENIFLL